MRPVLVMLILGVSLPACTSGASNTDQKRSQSEASGRTDFGTCSDLDVTGNAISLAGKHAKSLAGTEWIGRWCDPRLQGTHNDPKGKLVRRFVKWSDTAHDNGVVAIESFFHTVHGVRRWPKNDGSQDVGYIAEGKLTFVTSTKPWYLEAIHTGSNCIAFTWHRTVLESGAAIRNYVQNCDPEVVSAITAE